MNNLFRMQNVSARRTERISSDEEERARKGYDLRTGIEFADVGPPLLPSGRSATRRKHLATLTYGERATLWRINLGWARRDHTAGQGFRLDVERGYWARPADDTDPEDPMGPRTEVVVPYVEDRRNASSFGHRRSSTVTPVTVERSPLGCRRLSRTPSRCSSTWRTPSSPPSPAEPRRPPHAADLRGLRGRCRGAAPAGRRRRRAGRGGKQALELCHFDPARATTSTTHPTPRSSAWPPATTAS